MVGVRLVTGVHPDLMVITGLVSVFILRGDSAYPTRLWEQHSL